MPRGQASLTAQPLTYMSMWYIFCRAQTLVDSHGMPSTYVHMQIALCFVYVEGQMLYAV